jgi:hypothetical protein
VRKYTMSPRPAIYRKTHKKASRGVESLVTF